MILVVGGAGFIGSHMAKLLAAEGREFVVFDNLERGHRAALRGAPLHVGDLRNREQVQAVFLQNRIDLVIHFAAYIEVGESVSDPAKFYENNVVGTLNLLRAMREAGVGKIVFSSTAAIYGEPESTPIGEDHPKRPTSPYGDTKWAVERMLQAYDQAYGMRSVALRYFNAAGADPDGEIGEDHRPETHLIPRVLLNALGRAEFKIFGDDYETADGTCVRDYVHVTDLASAHLRAVDYLEAGGQTDAFNLGNGRGFSVREIVDVASRVTDVALDPKIEARRPGDPAVLVASNERARDVLGWRPMYDDTEEIVTHAYRWFRENPEGYVG